MTIPYQPTPQPLVGKPSDAMKAKLRERLAMQKPNSPNTVATEREIKEYRANPEAVGSTYPVALVTAAVKATDLFMPSPLEERVILIAEMFLNGKKAAEIAGVLGLEVHIVAGEIKRMEHQRAVAVQNNPELAARVAEKHFDVMDRSVKLIEHGQKILSMYAEEMESNHNLRIEADKRKDPYASKMGIGPHQLQAFFLGVEALGKQKDRIATMQGLMGKTIDANAVVQQTNVTNNVQFNSPQLNDVVDALMKTAGHAILGGQQAVDTAKRMAHEQIIEASVETAFPALQQPIIDV